MRSFSSLLPLLAAGVAYALPQAESSCTTITTELIVPTTTYTFDSTVVVTETATTPDDLGTFTDVVRVSSTGTIQTVTPAAGNCTASPTTTVFTTAGASVTNHSTSAPAGPSGYARMFARQDAPCTETTYTFTTTYGVTYTYLPASETSTYTQYSEFTMATVTATESGYTAYAVATGSPTPADCGPTKTMDARCAPSAMQSQAQGFGLEWLSDNSVGSGAVYTTTTTDASQCCQMCAEADSCAGSAWDIRSNQCRLEFAVDYNSGALACGNAPGLAYYDAGPNHPMAPGTGWYVANMCGSWTFGSAKPDDGT